MGEVKLSEVIAPSFYKLHQDVKNEVAVHYWLDGGRGSTKSSFVGEEISLGMMKDPNANAVAFRRYASYLRESVYEQLVWAIEKLGVSDYWKKQLSPLSLIYLPTGQKIVFRGADDPELLKAVKLAKGYFKYLWFEELNEFGGPEDIRKITQSFVRGGDKAAIFYTYNPPKSVKAWVNEEARIERPDRIIHHSTYLDVPPAWLGKTFIEEAEHLKKTNPKAYAHEYLGEITGTGGEIFANVVARKITDEEIASFDHIHRALDWGYAVDPFHYTENHYDKTRSRLYIFFEIHQVGLSNRLAAEKIKVQNKDNGYIIADSAEPKSISELISYGLKVRKSRKGPGSVEYGIKRLADLEEIIIDPERCPNTYREFVNYELDRDAHGNWKADYPDKDNHSIDSTRYSLEDEFRERPERENLSGKGAM